MSQSPALSRIAQRRAGMAGLLWIGGLEKRLFADPLSYGDLTLLSDLRHGRVLEFYCRERAPSPESRIGYLIFVAQCSRIELLRIAVVPARQRRGYGRELLDCLAAMCCVARQPRILVGTAESEVAQQNFFAACGFRAVSLVHQPAGDVLQFERRVDGREPTEFSVLHLHHAARLPGC